MKSPANMIVSVLFTVTAAIFWYGGYSVFAIQAFFVRYWVAILAASLTFTAGRFW